MVLNTRVKLMVFEISDEVPFCCLSRAKHSWRFDPMEHETSGLRDDRVV